MEDIVDGEGNQEVVKALKSFPYFETWNNKTISDCCRLSKIRKVPPDNIVFGSEVKELNYTYFIIEGTGKLIEHLLLVPNVLPDGRTRYSAFRDKSAKSQNNAENKVKYSSLLFNTETDSRLEELQKKSKIKMKEMSKTSDRAEKDRNEESQVKRTTKFLQFYRRVLPYLLRKNESVLQKLDCVESHFLQIAFVRKGCCLGLGENLQNRFLVSVTEVTCLVIPLQFLLQHNPNNLWNRIKQFLNNYLPDENRILSEFIINRRWDSDKRKLIALKCGRESAKMSDVPKSIRLVDSYTRPKRVQGSN